MKLRNVLDAIVAILAPGSREVRLLLLLWRLYRAVASDGRFVADISAAQDAIDEIKRPEAEVDDGDDERREGVEL